MAQGPRWVELTRAVGEINARLIAGDLENEGIRTHIELEGSAWLYAGEDPNRMATIYVLEEDLQKAESVLEQASAGETADGVEATDFDSEEHDEFVDVSGSSTSYPILAQQDSGLRSRPLRWLIAAVILGALLFSLLQETSLDFLDLGP